MQYYYATMDGKSPQTTDVCLLGVIMLTTRGFIRGGQGGPVPLQYLEHQKQVSFTLSLDLRALTVSLYLCCSRSNVRGKARAL